MTLDERLRAAFGDFDVPVPDAGEELQSVRRTTTKRRRSRRATGIAAAIVVGAVTVAAVLQFTGDDGTRIRSGPAADTGDTLLIPTAPPEGMALIGVESPNAGSGTSGGGPPFAFSREYARYSADKSHLEGSFTLQVGLGDANTDVYRSAPGEPTQVHGFPAKISSDAQRTTLVWIDDAGRIFGIFGDISTAEALDVANHLVIDPNGAMEPQLVKPERLPAGFVHLVDIPNPRPITFAGRYGLTYATPNYDATLRIVMDTQPTETVDELLLSPKSHVVEVRGHRGVFVDQPGIGRELRWLEPPHTLVTMNATTVTETQLRDIAEGLRPISAAEWEQLNRDTGPLRGPSNSGTNPAPTVTPLRAIGPKVIAGSGDIDGKDWELVVYEVSPATGETARRFCYELRGAQNAPQSCFPLQPQGLGTEWLYAERHLGRWFLLGAAPHGAPTELGANDGQPVPLQIFDEASLPMQVFVAALPDPYNGYLGIGSQETSIVQLSGPAPDGTRRPFGTPVLPGVYPEFSQLAAGLGGATPSTKAGPPKFCAAVEEFRSAGLVDGATGLIKVEALPYLRRMRDAAPADIQNPIDVIIQWLEQGAPLPRPAEEVQAESQSTQDWVRRC